jgi:hypothetical protein
MELEYRHSFSPDEARERVRALTDYLSNKHGMKVQWTGPDSAKVQGKYTLVSIEADLTLESGRVQVQGKDPGFMWRVPAKKYIEGKLVQYLDSAKSLDILPRA